MNEGQARTLVTVRKGYPTFTPLGLNKSLCQPPRSHHTLQSCPFPSFLLQPQKTILFRFLWVSSPTSLNLGNSCFSEVGLSPESPCPNLQGAMKRACDCCIRRKVKCDGNHPCRKCNTSRPQLTCTYLTPAQKRGPKPSKAALFRRRPKKITPLPTQSKADGESTEVPVVPGDRIAASPVTELAFPAAVPTVQNVVNVQSAQRVPYDVLRSVIEVYQSRMYPVWPVIDTNKLLGHLEDENSDMTTYILATSLCAATMAQLHLPPTGSQAQEISSADLERECSRVRATCDYREHPSLNHVLTSFFLHVYHAKVDNQNSALLYIQEAILLARLLKLDEDDGPYHGDDAESVADGCIVYLLLWISERWVLSRTQRFGL